MAFGKAAARRNTAKKKAKQCVKNAAKEQKNGSLSSSEPHVTEHDLLAFQLFHFGDGVRPADWFIDAETALNYDPYLEDDGLGYYEDGVKRTLTDEQIEMFRHSEIEMMLRDERLQAEQESAADERKLEVGVDGRRGKGYIVPSPVSDASSLEDELLGLAPKVVSKAQPPPLRRDGSLSTQSTRSDSTAPRKRQRASETPYDQRHKRKWEAYIEENDPVEGSLTHRRIAREMDTQTREDVELDY